MTSGTESARLKLKRAKEHVNAIKAHIAVYVASLPYEIRGNGAGVERIKVTRQPPREISLRCGEVIYQIRSALDHLAFQLVGLNASVLASGWEQNCAFPLLLEVPKKYAIPVPYEYFEKQLPKISREAYEFIENLQPYKNRNEIAAQNRFLRFVAQLANIDKHRHLHLTAPRIRKDEQVISDCGMERGHWSILNDGSELEKVAGFSRSFETIVTFDEPKLGDGCKMQVEYLLGTSIYMVEMFVLPAFEKFTQPNTLKSGTGS